MHTYMHNESFLLVYLPKGPPCCVFYTAAICILCVCINVLIFIYTSLGHFMKGMTFKIQSIY